MTEDEIRASIATDVSEGLRCPAEGCGWWLRGARYDPLPESTRPGMRCGADMALMGDDGCAIDYVEGEGFTY